MEPIKEIEFDRIYDASILNVWDAWTRPELVKQWWGPDNVSIPECDIELRVGGRVRIVMEAGRAMGPVAGMLWPMEGEFTGVEAPVKLSYSVAAWIGGQEETTKIQQTQELTLEDVDGTVRLHLKAAITSAQPGAAMAIKGMWYGYSQQLDKLAGFLART